MLVPRLHGPTYRKHAARFLVALVLVLAAFPVASPAAAQEEPTTQTGFRPRIVRSGTVSLYGAGMYGTLLGGPFSDTFNSGMGIGFALRYRNSQESSLGIGFEAHQFDSKIDADSAATPKNLKFVITTLDYYRHYSVRSRTPRYLVIGAGLMQATQENLNEEREFPGDGGVIKAGGGVEYWLNRTLTAEFGVRYYGVFSRQVMNHDVQAALGIVFYTSP